MGEYHLRDDEVAILSTERQRRIATEVLGTLRRNLSAIPTDDELIACANNLAAAWGCYGVQEQSREVDYSVPVDMVLSYLKESGEK